MTFEEIKAQSERLGPLASFATIGFDGTPHVVPLVPIWVEDELVFGAGASSLKVRHLHLHPAAAMQYLTPGEGFPDALLLKGSAVVVDDDAGKQLLWDSGLFPFLPEMYDGPADPGLCFVRFAPNRASLIREGGRGAPSSWRAATSGGPDVHPTG